MAENDETFLVEIADSFNWGALPLYEALGELCVSHNADVATLHDPKFQVNFGGAAAAISTWRTRISAVLERLRRLDPRLAAPRRVYPMADDFED